MGRTFLSTKFQVEVVRPETPVMPHPPKFVDAPFDLDSEFDSDDVVYEAFCTPEEYKDHVEATTAAVGRRSISPASSTDSSSSGMSPPPPPVVPSTHDERARSLPYFPTFIRRLADGREVQTESPLPNLPRIVAELRPILNLPEVRAALPDADLLSALHPSESQEEIHLRAIRIRRALRPHIVEFLRHLPMTSDAGYIAGLVERALVLDDLGARGLDYFEAITRLEEHEGLESTAEGTPATNVATIATTSGPHNFVIEPRTSSPSRTATPPAPQSSTANITINPSEWWFSRAESRSPPTLPVPIRAEFAPSLGPTQPPVPLLHQNYLAQDPDASDSSGSSRPDSPLDDPLPPRPSGVIRSTGGFIPRTGIPSSGQMFAAFTEMANGDGSLRNFSDTDWYNYPLYSGPLR